MFLDFELWKKALTDPKKTFKKQAKKAELGEGVKHIGIAGVIAGIIAGIAALVLGSAAGSMFGTAGLSMGAGFGAAAFLASVILTPIFAVIGWLIGSGILYIFAMIFGGKGSYTKQSYLIAIYYAPLMIISAVLMLIPVVGQIVNFLVGLYSLYLLTMALKETHDFSTGKAVGVWLVPLIIVIVIVVILGVTMLGSLMGMAGMGSMPTGSVM